jgi:lantibiotic modifying enzyme
MFLLPMQLHIDDLLPHQHLDTAFEGVTAALERLHLPKRRQQVILALKRSLRNYVRTELTNALSIIAQPLMLPEALRHHARGADNVSAESLRGFAGLRATQWATGVLELFSRLEEDWRSLVRDLTLEPDAMLVGVSRPLGDAHHDGRSVHRLDFSNGSSLIYKPRSVETEHAFGALIKWLSANGCELRLRHCKVLPRCGYGWTEYIPTTFCETTRQMTEFYRRQGGFLALFWLLCAGDAIGDNVVVAGEHPVWIDSECLSRPDLTRFLGGQLAFPLWIRESMLMTAMVLYGVAPIGARHFRTNTGLSVSCTEDRLRAFTSDDVLRAPFIEAIVLGFQDIYRWFLAHRTATSFVSEMFAFCEDRHVRVILRSTQAYSVLIWLLAVTPEAAKAEVIRDIYEVLRDGDPPRSGPFTDDIVEAELYALQRGDVPYWSASTSSLDLRESHGPYVRDACLATCIECMHARRARMGETDLARQVWLLESFLGGGARQEVLG